MPGKAGQTRYDEGPRRVPFSYILTPLLFTSRPICNRWLGPPYISGLLEANWLTRDFSYTQYRNGQTEPYVLLQITINGPAPRGLPAPTRFTWYSPPGTPWSEASLPRVLRAGAGSVRLCPGQPPCCHGPPVSKETVVKALDPLPRVPCHEARRPWPDLSNSWVRMPKVCPLFVTSPRTQQGAWRPTSWGAGGRADTSMAPMGEGSMARGSPAHPKARDFSLAAFKAPRDQPNRSVYK